MRPVILVTVLCAASAWADEANWSVRLTDLGDQKINVIKIVREQTGLGLKDAKDLVEAPKPRLIKAGLSKADADALVAELAEKGATAEARQEGESGPARSRRAAPVETEFEVRLDEMGQNKISVIKVVRELTGLGLAEAKTVVESAPVVLKERVERDLARKMASDLSAVGAKVTLTPKKR